VLQQRYEGAFLYGTRLGINEPRLSLQMYNVEQDGSSCLAGSSGVVCPRSDHIGSLLSDANNAEWSEAPTAVKLRTNSIRKTAHLMAIVIRMWRRWQKMLITMTICIIELHTRTPMDEWRTSKG
jgi:hypothetical protein